MQKIYLSGEENKTLKVLLWIAELAVVCAIGLFLSQYVFFPKETQSKSMEPGIAANSIVLTDRLSYILAEPERFDVVTFTRKEKDPSADVLIRRIIGLPGETVRIERGVVYINGNVLDVSGYIGEITSDGIAEKEIQLNSKEYFVLGDTPANSEDSRSSTIGAVLRTQILGKTRIGFKSVTEMYLIE